MADMGNMPKYQSALSLKEALINIARDNDRLNIFMDMASGLSSAHGRSGDGSDSGDIDNTGAIHNALAGFSVAIKANIAVRGLPFTAGMGAFRNRIAEQDAPVVTLLREAGAIILGTVNMDEAALGAETNNPHFGRTENPRWPGFTAGGSSGGSAAAVAAGFARAALGTDTMGSCRIPAAYCGVVGYKPSYGRIGMNGIEPLSRRLDHVGVLAANMADIVLVADVVCQFDSSCIWAIDYAPPAVSMATSAATAHTADATHRTLPNPIVGLEQHRFAVLDEASVQRLQPAVAKAYQQAVRTLRGAGAITIARSVDPTLLAAVRRAGLLLCEAELAISLAAEYQRDDAGVSQHLRSMIAFGAHKSAVDLVRAGAKMDAAILIERQLLQGVDALLWPTAPQTAFAFDQPVPPDQADFTCLANFTGAAALSLPLPVGSGSMPVGLQIMTRRGADAELLAIGWAIEKIFSLPHLPEPR